MHKALCCTCCQIPPYLYFYFSHLNELLCNSAIDAIFPILFCCNHRYCIFLFVPTIYCCRPTSFLFVFVSSPVLCYPCLLPLPSSICVYGIYCSCMVYCSIQPPTQCLPPHFFLCLCILTFLHLGVASFVLFYPPPPMSYSL